MLVGSGLRCWSWSVKFSVRRECKVEVEREVDGEEKEIMLVKVWDERGRKGGLDGDGEGEGGMPWWGEDAE